MRIALLMGTVGGAIVAVGTVPDDRLMLAWQGLHALLLGNWLLGLPWVLALVFFVLWRRAARRAAIWRAGSTYWLDEYTKTTPRRKARAR